MHIAQSRTSQSWQLPNRLRLLRLIDMSINIHRQADIAVAGEGLGRLGGDVGAAEVGDEGVAKAVEVGVFSFGVLVF